MSGETTRRLHGTMRFAMYLAIVFTALNFVNALPFPQFDNGELVRFKLYRYPIINSIQTAIPIVFSYLICKNY